MKTYAALIAAAALFMSCKASTFQSISDPKSAETPQEINLDEEVVKKEPEVAPLKEEQRHR